MIFVSNIKNKISNRINCKLLEITYASDWYNNIIFKYCQKFWNHNEYNLDVINFGSGSGLFAFLYDGLPVKGVNFAMWPQKVAVDFELLLNYCSYLKKEATVIFPMTPFSSLTGSFNYVHDKYYTILQTRSIPNFNLQKCLEINRIKNNPIQYIPYYEIKKEIKRRLKNKIHKRRFETPIIEDFNKDADRWIDYWKEEFHIISFDDELSLKNKYEQELFKKTLSEICNFCKDHKYQLIFVFPPVTEELYSRLYTILDKTVYSIIKKYDKDSLFIDYSNDVRFKNHLLYQNSYFLNEKGAKLFTKQVLEDIGILR